MKRRGFTLIEIMFVFAIAGAITTMAFVGIGALKRDGRDKERMSDRDNIGTAIKAYQSAKEGELPTVGVDPATNQIILDGSGRIDASSPLITSGYLDSTEAYQDPLARSGGSKVNYRIVTTPPIDCGDGQPNHPTDTQSATMFYEIDAATNKSFKLSVCLEAGQANDKDFEI